LREDYDVIPVENRTKPTLSIHPTFQFCKCDGLSPTAQDG